jgi:hypothetical protein
MVAIDPNVIPQEVKYAHAELSNLFLTKDRTTESSVAAQGLTRIKTGPINLEFREYTPETQVIPDSIINLLVPSWIECISDYNGMERELTRT